MQNEQTLIGLGFQKSAFEQHLFRGTHFTFAAKIVDYNGPVTFVELFKVSDKIDMRPNSKNKGRHYQSLLKQCVSDGSVGRAIAKYDKPEIGETTIEDHMLRELAEVMPLEEMPQQSFDRVWKGIVKNMEGAI
jgi:hypothetical protein